MKFNQSLALLALVSLACSSAPKGGSGEVDNIYPTQFASPEQVNNTEVSNEKYAKQWTKSVGGGYDDFKKITIPAYTIEFVSSVNAVDQNKFAAAFDKSDGGKSILDMQIVLPVEKHAALLQEITNESYARMKEKFKKLGFEVAEWNDVKAASEDAREFEKEKMTMEPFANRGNTVSVAAKGLGRLNTMFWGPSAGSTARDAKVMMVIPHFTVGFGYFGGENKPQTITENHGAANLKFTPQIQIYTGSGVKTFGKYEGGTVVLDKTAVTDKAFASKLVKFGDNKADMKAKEEATRHAAAAYHGTNAQNIGVSSRAGVSYDVQMDPTKFKAAVLEQMSLVEDMIIARYKTEL